VSGAHRDAERSVLSNGQRVAGVLYEETDTVLTVEEYLSTLK
jgi:hypothetical protein